jgi:hypothetical protein
MGQDPSEVRLYCGKGRALGLIAFLWWREFYFLSSTLEIDSYNLFGGGQKAGEGERALAFQAFQYKELNMSSQVFHSECQYYFS